MGVEIHGKAPRSEAGRYFAANWRVARRPSGGVLSRCSWSVLADR